MVSNVLEKSTIMTNILFQVECIGQIMKGNY